MATTQTMTIEFAAEQRADGCYHLKSPQLPGFHFIVGEDEKPADFEKPLSEALRIFMPQFLKAQALRKQEQAAAVFTITETRPRLNFRAELQFA